MASNIIREGRLVRDQPIDRGEMIVHTEEEWRRRERDMVQTFNKYLKGILVVWSILIVTFFTGAHLIFPDMDLWQYVPLVFLYSVILVPPTIVIMIKVRNQDRKTPIGLYENGIQIKWDTYLPYREIGETRRVNVWTLKGRMDVIFLKERMKRVVFPYNWVQWYRWEYDLDKEGIDELERRVQAASSPK